MEAASGGVDVRRRQMLSESRAVSANLRDLLGIKQEDNSSNNNVNNMNNCDNNDRNLVGLTLGAVLSGDIRSMSMPVQSNRTLLDIIRDEPFGKNGNDGKKSWKLLKQKFKIRGAGSGSGWASSISVRASDGAVNNNRVVARRNSTGLICNLGSSTQQTEPEGSSSSTSLSVIMRSSSAVTLNSNQVVDRGSAGDFGGGNAQEGQGESPEGGAGEQPVRMSLMALLEETDRQMGIDGSAYMIDDDEEDEFVDADVDMDMDVDVDVDVDVVVDVNANEHGNVGIVDRDAGGERVEDYNSCCVCMVRHKGAAFIPCGHTFCRLCSRELWVQRGNCPLCNHLIMEILDIF